MKIVYDEVAVLLSLLEKGTICIPINAEKGQICQNSNRNHSYVGFWRFYDIIIDNLMVFTELDSVLV